jgi:MFS family permease
MTLQPQRHQETAIIAAASPLLASAAAAHPPAWRWVHVAVAALAMVATLPGRTHGLGLITEPLLRDMHLDRVAYGSINLWATLLGAVFCLPCGWLVDRLGARFVLTTLLAALGAVVVVMSQVQGDWFVSVPMVGIVGAVDLFILVLLTRGLGQSALSVVSLALMGQAAGRRPGVAVGVYSCLVALGFMAAFGVIMLCDTDTDWRTLWLGVGWALFVCAILSVLLVRPAVSGWSDDRARATLHVGPVGMTLREAMATPAFWVFALATSFYGMIAAGVSLFNQSILEERGFDRSVFLTVTTVTPLIGVASNLVTGWFATRYPLGRLLAIAMLLLGGALVAFPYVTALWQVYIYAAVMGVAGGMVTVLFFAVWGQAFGPAHLGKIQGAAQMLTVIASALGPLLLAVSNDLFGSYVPLFQMAAGAAAFFAVAACLTPVPRPEVSRA